MSGVTVNAEAKLRLLPPGPLSKSKLALTGTAASCARFPTSTLRLEIVIAS